MWWQVSEKMCFARFVRLVAHPAASIRTALFVLEKYWRHWKMASSFPDMSDQTHYELMTSEDLDSHADNFDFKRHIRALHRRYVEDFPQKKPRHSV